MRALVRACVLGALLGGCTVAEEAMDVSSSPSPTLYRIDGLECRVDSFESGMPEYPNDAVGSSTPEAEVEAFLDSPTNRRFSALVLDEEEGLTFSFADSDGLVQLVIQVTDQFEGYLIASYSYCTEPA